MLSLLWIIVKIILIILLSVFGILVAFLLVIIFVPFCYDGQFSWLEQKANGVVKVSWLFHIIGLRMDVIDNQVNTNVQLFGRNFKKKKKSSSVSSKKKEKASENQHMPSDTALSANPKEQEKDEAKTGETKEGQEKEIKQERARYEERKTKRTDFGDRARHVWKKIQTGWNKIKSGKMKWETWMEQYHDEKNQASIRLLKKEGIRILKSLAPKKFAANLHVGLGDPSYTGLLLGAVACFMPIYEDAVCLEPNFEEPMLEGDVMFKGKLRLGTFVLTAIRMWNDKNLRTIIKKLIR